MKQTDPQIKLRLPADIKERVQAAAKRNRRSMTSEIAAQLSPALGSIEGATRTQAPTGSIAPFGLRMLPDLREQVEASARASGRSMNAEIVAAIGSALVDGRKIQDSPSRHSDKFMLRLPEGMRDEIAEAAKLSGRSMNSEIVGRLSGRAASVADDIAEIRRALAVLAKAAGISLQGRAA